MNSSTTGTQLYWRFVDALGMYLFYYPLRLVFNLLQKLMQGYLDSYYILSDQERIARQDMLESRQAWLRLYLVWLVILLVAIISLLVLGYAYFLFRGQFLGGLTVIVFVLVYVYFTNIMFFWRDYDRFMRGLRYTDHEMYLSPFLVLNEDLTLHFFSIADFIASGVLSKSKVKMRKQIESGLAEAFLGIRRRIESGDLDGTAELRFHQYALHPQSLIRWGFETYEPTWGQRLRAKAVALLVWPRVAYLSSITRPQPLRLSDIQRFSFVSGKAIEIYDQ